MPMTPWINIPDSNNHSVLSFRILSHLCWYFRYEIWKEMHEIRNAK
jgi:hypothetical protein